MIVKLLTEHLLEFLSLKGGYRGSSESTHVKIPHCWKSHATAHIQRVNLPTKGSSSSSSHWGSPKGVGKGGSGGGSGGLLSFSLDILAAPQTENFKV